MNNDLSIDREFPIIGQGYLDRGNFLEVLQVAGHVPDPGHFIVDLHIRFKEAIDLPLGPPKAILVAPRNAVEKTNFTLFL